MTACVLQVPLLLLLLLLAGSWPLYDLQPLLSDESITVEGECVHRIGLLSGVGSGADALEDEFIWGEPEQKFGLLVSYTSSGKNLPEPLPNITDWCAAPPPVQQHQCTAVPPSVHCHQCTAALGTEGCVVQVFHPASLQGNCRAPAAARSNPTFVPIDCLEAAQESVQYRHGQLHRSSKQLRHIRPRPSISPRRPRR